MNKLIHGPNVSGQSLVDRVMAAKHTVAGQSLAKVICKATTEEVLGPKRKHLDYLIQCTNEPNVSIPQMANLLIERTQNASWVVVFKSLVTVHNLMNYGNERFTQYLASNNCSFNLGGFTDKSGTQGYDMSNYIRRYSKYLNEKAFSYRQMAFDFCKVKRGKEDGLLRTMNTEKLLKTLPGLQTQLDALVEFDATPNELTNGVINAGFMLLFKDLIRLFACYNDGIINLLEKYFEMNKKHCREALDVYKKFLGRMDRVCDFLKVAESVGIDKGDIPDLAKAPSSLLEALEQHLISLENSKKTGSTTIPKPAAGVSAVISTYAAAAQIGAAPGAGSGAPQISEEERRRILEEEQRQLDHMKSSIDKVSLMYSEQQRLKQMATSSPTGSTSSSSTAPATRSVAMTTTASPKQPPGDGAVPRGSPQGSNSLLSDDLFAMSSYPVGGATYPGYAGVAYPPNAGYPAGINPFSPTPTGGGTMMPGTAWGGPAYGSGSGGMQQTNHFATDANFAAVFGSSNGAHQTVLVTSKPVASPGGVTGFDGFGEVLRPMGPSNPGLTAQNPNQSQALNKHDKLITPDLDSSLASLAGNLSIRPAGQVKKTDHQWTASSTEKRMTGGAGPAWNQPAGAGLQTAPSYPMQPMGMQPGGVAMAMAPGMMPGYPLQMQVQPRPMMMGQPGGVPGGWSQPPSFGTPQQQQHPTMHHNAPNDPFGSL